MAVKTSDAYADEFRKALAEVDTKLTPLQQERERLATLLAAAEGKLKTDGGSSSKVATRSRKQSVPLPQAKNRVSHLVRQSPNQSGAFYRRKLAEIPGHTVDEALRALVADKKITATGEKNGRRYASSS